MPRDSNLPPRFWADSANGDNEDERGDNAVGAFLWHEPDVGHVRSFGCVVSVTLPNEALWKLDDRGVGYKYEGS